jgi:serine/threonine-protein kinase
MSICPTCQAEFGSDVRFCPRDGSVLQASGQRADLVGQVINQRYRILRLLGEGGWGQVYLAEHVRMGRRDAIKILNQSISGSADAVGRFQREALNASRIVHPNVVAIYDFGETTERMLYIAMEYVEGQTLSRLLRASGPLPTARALHIARQIADALAAAHDMSIVHRDLKPDNILITPSRDGSDRVKVVDFGIAKATGESDQKITRTGFAVGTPGYMSPEQLVGDEVDARSDLYSLSCILYEMLTGEQAFLGPSTEMVLQRLTQPPPRLRERNVRISSALDDLVARGMATKPIERFQSAADFCDAINAILQAGTDGVLQLRSWGNSTAGSVGERIPGEANTDPGRQPSSASQGDISQAGAKSTVAGALAIEMDPVPRREGSRDRALSRPVMSGGMAIAVLLLLVAGGGIFWEFRTMPTEVTSHDSKVAAAEPTPAATTPREASNQESTRASVPASTENTSARIPREAGRNLDTTVVVPVTPGVSRSEISERSAPRSHAGGIAERPVPGHPVTLDIPDRPRRDQLDVTGTPVRPATPPASTLAAVRTLIQTGRSAALRADFESAFGMFVSAEAQLAGLQKEYPESKEVKQLVNERASELAEASKACESLRMVRLLRNEAAPQCH